ncbi:protein TolA [Massilia eurypsychrophila]|uniref:Protein TolA n=1 Tax=Massilia eurypsychrophila TaxID=1485217 RepID=A0A2G8TF21_9BURK|nr:cell envelope integrity protein TolA [Massilia eurypsychrophila]PIL44630.1 protein TolA [Massilia eurypsychrophila]
MTSATANGAPYHVPPEPSRWPSIVLAAAVHAGLLAFLYIGVSWQNTTPVQVEAEVWDMKTQSAAPPPPPPPEVIEPAPVPVPQPVPVPVPKVVQQPPPKVEEPVAPKAPDIALEREKRKAEKRKELEEEKKLEEQKLAKEMKAKQLADKKAQELADKKEQELADKKAEQKEQELAKKLEEKKLAEKLKAEKMAKAKEEAASEKRRAAELSRMMAGAGTSGEAAKSTASRVDTSYLAAINSKIKSSTSYAGSTAVPGKPEVVFKIEQLPSGEIISVRLTKSSGIPAFDDAVEKGILKSSPLPKNKNGTVLRTLEIAFAMKDLK